MKKLLMILTVMSVAGCTTDRETTTTTVVMTGFTTTATRTVTHTSGRQTASNETVVPGIRASLQESSAAFYAGTPAELCAVATAALVHERTTGSIQPVEGLFYDKDVAIGPDCTSDYAVAGIPLAASFPGQKTRRVSMPRQLADGHVGVDIDYDCDSKMCLGGTGYLLDKQGDQWVVDPQPGTSWIR